MAGAAQGPPTGRRRRRAVGPSSSVGPTAGSRDPEPIPPAEPAARELGWGEAHESTGSDDERLLREVPPHHGG